MFNVFFLFEWCVFATLLEIPQLQPHLKIGTCPSQRFEKSISSVTIIVGIIVGCCARVAASGGGCTSTSPPQFCLFSSMLMFGIDVNYTRLSKLGRSFEISFAICQDFGSHCTATMCTEHTHLEDFSPPSVAINATGGHHLA